MPKAYWISTYEKVLDDNKLAAYAALAVRGHGAVNGAVAAPRGPAARDPEWSGWRWRVEQARATR